MRERSAAELVGIARAAIGAGMTAGATAWPSADAADVIARAYVGSCTLSSATMRNTASSVCCRPRASATWTAPTLTPSPDAYPAVRPTVGTPGEQAGTIGVVPRSYQVVRCGFCVFPRAALPH